MVRTHIESLTIDETDAPIGTMGSASLSGVLESCSRDRANGEAQRISRFIAIVESGTSAEALGKRFASFSDCFEVRKGEELQY